MIKKPFKIDFFELMFLAQVCIPPVPIARAMFWQDLSDIHYHEMSQSERKRMFDFIVNQDNFTLENKDHDYFFCRFYKFNQYSVECEGMKGSIKVFKYEGKYHKSENTSINDAYILKAKLEFSI